MELNQNKFSIHFFLINYKQSAIIFLARHKLHSPSLGMSQLFLEFGFSAFLDTWAAVRRRLAKIPIVLSQTKTKTSNWRFWLDRRKKGKGRNGVISSSGVVGGKVGRKGIFMFFSRHIRFVFLSNEMQIPFQDHRRCAANSCALLISEQIILGYNEQENLFVLSFFSFRLFIYSYYQNTFWRINCWR